MLGRTSVFLAVTMMPSTRRVSSVRTYCRSRSGSPRASQSRTEIEPAPSASSTPCSSGMLNRPMLSLVIRPTV